VNTLERARRAHGPRTGVVASVAAVVVAAIIAGCAEPGTVVAPKAREALPAPKPADAGSRPPNVAASLVYCDVASIVSREGYRVRGVAIKVPRNIFDASGATVKIGVRGWAKDAPDPTQLALCTIHDNAAAREFFKTEFGVPSADPSAPFAVTDRGALASADAAGSRVTATGVEVFDAPSAAMLIAPCDPTAIYCEDQPPEEPVDEGPPPAEPPAPDLSLAPSEDGAALAPVIRCYGRTDYPHRSGYNVNVHGETGCDTPLPLSTSVSLQRQKCVWIFCWWSTYGSGYYANVATVARTNAAAFCQKGWWRGSSWHSVQFPFGYWPPSAYFNTYNFGYISFC
jgi:hypothetical protein